MWQSFDRTVAVVHDDPQWRESHDYRWGQVVKTRLFRIFDITDIQAFPKSRVSVCVQLNAGVFSRR